MADITQDTSQGSRKPKSKQNAQQKEFFSENASAGTPETVHSADVLKILHWRIDAEVLRLYDLPPVLERQVLDLFSGIRRRGVPLSKTEYFPKLRTWNGCRISWPSRSIATANLRRAKLIDLEEEERITPAQQRELDELQRLAMPA